MKSTIRDDESPALLATSDSCLRDLCQYGKGLIVFVMTFTTIAGKGFLILYKKGERDLFWTKIHIGCIRNG